METAKLFVGAWSVGVLVQDMGWRRISNLLTVGASLVGLAYLLATGRALLGADWQAVLFGVGFALALTLPACLAHWLGAADVKLALAIALLGGLALLTVSFVLGSLILIVATAGWLLLTRLRGKPLPSFPGRRLPFGAALAAGLLLVLGFQP